MRVVSHPEAARDLEAAVLELDIFHGYRGDVIMGQFERTLLRIVAEPERCRKFLDENRKAYFGRHSRYAIVYSVNGDVICIRALMDLLNAPPSTGKRATDQTA